MQIIISDLPVEIQHRIPLSLRINSNIIDMDQLPIEVQYELNNYFLVQEVNTYRPTVIYDTTFKYSIYNDLEILETKKRTIIEYIKNYLITTKGSYPFDPEYGNMLKYHLQTKDTELRKILISNELSNLMNLINRTFETQVKIIDSQVTRLDMQDHSEYVLSLEIEIDKSIVKLTVN